MLHKRHLVLCLTFWVHFKLVLYKYEPTSKVQPQNAAHTQAWGFVVLRVHLPQNAGPSSKVQPHYAAHTTASLAFFLKNTATPYESAIYKPLTYASI